MEGINPLTEKQMATLPQEINKDSKPIRFLADGCAINICTGVNYSKGSNIIYHPIYWDRPFSFIKMVLEFLRENNPGLVFKITYH